MARCDTCFRHCEIAEGRVGACGARVCEGGRVKPKYYGRISSLALDPIEKKPLAHFCPGSVILSAGSLGCNLRCPFCQNHEIAQAGEEGFRARTEEMPPEELARIALECRSRGNIGLAFTYNEPLTAWEYVRDTAKLTRDMGMANVLVTNGCASLEVLDAISPWIDAMNIDLKGFTEGWYSRFLGGDLGAVKAFIREAVKRCHVELTTLVVPGENDSEEEMRALSGWVASLTGVKGGGDGRDIPLHVTRFFPRHRLTDRGPTKVSKVYALAETARENLKYVYTGNC